jgi:hypothetical protein
MMDYNDKIKKKLAKAKVKKAKAEAKAKTSETESKAAMRFFKTSPIPNGVSITMNQREGRSQLVVSGLSDDQLKRLLPQVNKEVLITITEDTSFLRAGMMRFVREGIFQTAIKVVAGLIVGYLLIKLGLT